MGQLSPIRMVVILALAVLPWFAGAQERAASKPLVLSLAQAVRMALAPEGNIALQAADESVSVAKARLRASQAERWPNVEFSAAVQNQIVNLAAFGFESVQIPVTDFHFPDSIGPFNTFDARIRIRESLLDVSASRRGAAMRAAVETSANETTSARNRLAADVARCYVAAVRTEYGIEAARAAVVLAEGALEEARNRREAGQALALDVTRAESRLAAEREGLLDRQMQRALTVLQLLRLLNQDMDTPIELSDRLTPPAEELIPLEEALAAAVRSRAEFGMQRKRIETSERSDLAIHSERLPSVAVYSDFGSLGTTLPKSVGTYTVGIAVKVPIFDGGRREARREEVQAEIRQEKLRANDLKQQVELEVRQALLKLKLARQQVDLAKETEALAREELLRTQRRYDAGIGGKNELIESKANTARAVATHADAICAWHLARIDLLAAMGDIGKLA